MALVAAALVRFGLASKSARGLPPSSYAWGMALACGLLSAGAVLTCPGSEPVPAKVSGAVLGRLLLLVDGVLGLVLFSSILLSAPHSWAEPLGPAAVAISAMPLGMWSVAMMLCQTEGELIAAAPPALLFYSVATGGALYASGPITALPTAAFVVLHVALYLPLPLQDPDANPFHVWLRRFIRGFVQLMTQPVPSFGDDR